MIHLINISKAYYTRTGVKQVLHPVNMTLPTNRRIGLIGKNGSGKSTFLKIVAGVEDPDTGHVLRSGRISWPLGFGGGLSAEQTGVENAAFIARLYGESVDGIIQYVESFSELDEYLYMPVRTYSSGMKAKLTFALAMSIKFEFYLIDEMTSVGDKTFREKAQRAFRERADTSGLLFVSHNDKIVEAFCDIALVIHQGQLYPFENVRRASEFYNDLLSAEK